MKTRSKLVSLVVVISLILIVLFLERFSFPKSELLVDNSEQVNSEIEGFLAIDNSITNSPLEVQNSQCEPINETAAKASVLWRQHLRGDFSVKLYSGYSLAFIKALILSEGRLQADLVHRNLRAQTSSQRKSNERLASFISDMTGNNERMPGLSVSLKPKFFEEFFKLPLEQRTADKIPYGLTVDSVISEIERGALNTSELAELMALLSNINGFAFTPANGKPIDLSMAIVDSGNVELLNHYLKLGGVLTNPEVGINALERWVVKNAFKPNNELMLRSLVGHGLPLRVAKFDGDMLELGAFTYHFIRDSEYRLIQDWLVRNEVNIIESPDSRILKQQPEVAKVLELIEIEKAKLYRDNLVNATIEDMEFCQSVTNEVHNRIARRNYTELVEQARQQVGESQTDIVEYLNAIDPIASECFVKSSIKRKNTNSGKALTKSYTQATRLFHFKEPIRGLEVFLEGEHDDHEVAEFFWAVARINAEFLPKLVDAGIFPNKNDYLRAASMEPKSFAVIRDLGFPFEGVSELGDSLLKNAAARCNVALIEQLRELNYHYNASEIGVDSFEVALSRLRKCRTTDSKYALLDNLLKFDFEIQNFHRESLAALKLRHWEIYSKLLKKHPTIRVEDGTLAKDNSRYIRVG